MKTGNQWEDCIIPCVSVRTSSVLSWVGVVSLGLAQTKVKQNVACYQTINFYHTPHHTTPHHTCFDNYWYCSDLSTITCSHIDHSYLIKEKMCFHFCFDLKILFKKKIVNWGQSLSWYSDITHLFVTDRVINNDQSSTSLRKHYVTKKSNFWHFHFIDRIQFGLSLPLYSPSKIF